MPFRPNIRGPLLNFGTITCVTPGTSIALNSNFSPSGESDDSSANAYDYAIRISDLVLSAPKTNMGGILLILRKDGGAYTAATDIIAYIPAGSSPWSLASAFGPDLFGAEALSLDFENAGDVCYPVGILR